MGESRLPEQSWTLEERTCPNCGKSYRVLTTSLQLYCSNRCKQESEDNPKDNTRAWRRMTDNEHQVHRAKVKAGVE